MSDKCFIDSNIWLYAFMNDQESKSVLARQLIQRDSIHISVQILNEVCRNLLGKADYTEDELQATIQQFKLNTHIHLLTAEDSLTASNLRKALSLSYWDSLVVAAAKATGCRLLYSEDMQHQQRIDSLTILNPFKL